MNSSMNRIATLLFACAALAVAQDKITVPLSSPGQPATVKVRQTFGGITVVGGNNNAEVVVEGEGGTKLHQNESTPPPGMHRIDESGGLTAEEEHNVVTISGDHGIPRKQNLVVHVPVNTSLELKAFTGGKIEVTGVNGDIDVENMNGSIVLTNVSGAVVAHTMNGPITTSFDRVAADKPMSFSSMNGRIDVTLPSTTKARLRLKSTRGPIYTDFDVKMEPDGSRTTIEDSRNQNGRYRIQMDRSVYGSINGGGPEYSFQTMNGEILIHKK